MKKFVKMLSLVCLVMMAPLLMFGCNGQTDPGKDVEKNIEIKTVKMEYITCDRVFTSSGSFNYYDYYFEVEIINNKSEDVTIYSNNFNVEVVWTADQPLVTNLGEYLENRWCRVYTSHDNGKYKSDFSDGRYCVKANSSQTIYVNATISPKKEFTDSESNTCVYRPRKANISYNANQITSVYLSTLWINLFEENWSHIN